MDKSRDIVFISHATPEDNDFAIWVASRLQLLGYNVWIDKQALIGGEKFWENIDGVIRNQAAKILMVYSKNICQRDADNKIIPGKLKDGISKEISLAESIGKQNGINDFIILMNVDRSTYNLFIGADRLNQIPFYDNWADGFKQLLKKLEKDSIAKNNTSIDTEFSSWYSNLYLQPNGIIERRELYFNNWWDINQLPEYFYLFEFKTSKQAKAIYLSKDNKYPISCISNYISSFEASPEFRIDFEDDSKLISHQDVYRIKIEDVFAGIQSDVFPTQKDIENHFKSLLQRIFHLLMKERGLSWYLMANKRVGYFHTTKSLPTRKIKFEYQYRTSNRTKTKNLIGKYKSLGIWHFGISGKPILFPTLKFSLKNLLVFTSDGSSVWAKKNNEVDVDKIHTHRRSKGKKFFNEEWRDLLIAFLSSLQIDGKIEISLSSKFKLQMPLTTQALWSNFGYFDPKDKSRHGILSMYESIEDNSEEIDDEEIDK